MIAGEQYMLKTVIVAEDSMRVTDDDLNDVHTGVGFWIVVASSLLRNGVLPPSVLFQSRFFFGM